MCGLLTKNPITLNDQRSKRGLFTKNCADGFATQHLTAATQGVTSVSLKPNR
jgi:hypothetical protein